MTLTLLLDLDDTLLDTNLRDFVPAYFRALATDLAPRIAPELMARALAAGTQAMNASVDFSRTLEQVFASEFYSMIGIPEGGLAAPIEHFYDHVFPSLKDLTRRLPEAVPFVAWAALRGYRLAIATDPLLPRKAAHHRLRWAGFEPGQFELVSSFEDFHFSKSHPAYYAEVLGRLGWPDGPVVMVGNDLERDILPARELGLTTFHITGAAAPDEGGVQGDLPGLRKWLEGFAHASIVPAINSTPGLSAILSATPAVLHGMTCSLDESSWSQPTAVDEWSMTELICHLRDTEIEIHQMQMKRFDEMDNPFIPRPDTSVWASQRNYLHESGREALAQFIAARKGLIDKLIALPPEAWSRRARHAIFGPTDFREVIRFMADHDRLHIQQAWRMLRKSG